MNELAPTKPVEAFRAVAADRMKTAADMTLHQLVDEYVRLSKIVSDNTAPAKGDEDDWTGPEMNGAGQTANRERSIINGAAKVRFGMEFAYYDTI